MLSDRGAGIQYPPTRRRKEVDSSQRLGDAAVFVGVLSTMVVGLWARHGGWGELLKGDASTLLSLGQLSGLLASLAALFGLSLAGRPRFLERVVGLDTLLVWHRWAGGSSAILLAIHVITEVLGRADTTGFLSTIKAYSGGEAYMALASLGAIGFAVVSISSLRSIRRRMPYETWYFIHLLAYASLALAFLHEMYIGVDLSNDRVAYVFWITLNVAAFAMAILGRWGAALVAVLRPLRVTTTRTVAPGITEVTLTGARIRKLEASPGQFAFLRTLAPGLWWQSHPFSLSSAPNTNNLKFTIKQLGDASTEYTVLRPGMRVALEGPYGSITPEHIGTSPVLLVAGGVGVAAVKSLLEGLPDTARPVLLYRARSRADLAHMGELTETVERLGGSIHTAVGRRNELGADPFDPAELTRTVPGLLQRHVVICGPESLIRAAARGAKAAGVPTDRIDHERVWW